MEDHRGVFLFPGSGFKETEVLVTSAANRLELQAG
jgi:hypothetical protein